MSWNRSILHWNSIWRGYLSGQFPIQFVGCRTSQTIKMTTLLSCLFYYHLSELFGSTLRAKVKLTIWFIYSSSVPLSSHIFTHLHFDMSSVKCNSSCWCCWHRPIYSQNYDSDAKELVKYFEFDVRSTLLFISLCTSNQLEEKSLIGLFLEIEDILFPSSYLFRSCCALHYYNSSHLLSMQPGVHR